MVLLRTALLYLQGEIQDPISGAIVQGLEMRKLEKTESLATFVGGSIAQRAQPGQSCYTYVELTTFTLDKSIHGFVFSMKIVTALKSIFLIDNSLYFLTFSFLRAASLYLQGENPAISGSIVQNIEMKNLGNCESPVTFVGEIINSQAQPTQS